MMIKSVVVGVAALAVGIGVRVGASRFKRAFWCTLVLVILAACSSTARERDGVDGGAGRPVILAGGATTDPGPLQRPAVGRPDYDTEDALLSVDRSHVRVTAVHIHPDGTQDVQTTVITAEQDAADRARRAAMDSSTPVNRLGPEAIIQDTGCDDHDLWLYSNPYCTQERLCVYNQTDTPQVVPLTNFTLTGRVYNRYLLKYTCVATTWSDQVYEYYPGNSPGHT